MAQCDSAICPCGSGDTYVRCCGRFIQRGETAPTAEALMRSRYSAYVLGETAYVRDTWAVATRPVAPGEVFTPGKVKWLGLKILHVEDGQAHQETGVVEFVARYKIQGKAYCMHERSRFVRRDGRWLYLDGEQR